MCQRRRCRGHEETASQAQPSDLDLRHVPDKAEKPTKKVPGARRGDLCVMEVGGAIEDGSTLELRETPEPKQSPWETPPPNTCHGVAGPAGAQS